MGVIHRFARTHSEIAALPLREHSQTELRVAHLSCSTKLGRFQVQSKLSVLVDKAQQLSTTGDKHAKVLQALLRRICMNGYVPWNALVPIFDALHNQESNPKGSRVLHYLVGCLLSCGSAGTSLRACELARLGFLSAFLPTVTPRHDRKHRAPTQCQGTSGLAVVPR